MSLYGDIYDDHVVLARFLISRGADVNLTGPDDSCEFLRFRSLLVRGRAKTNDLNERIARLPNGACWKVLSYWREDN